MKQSERNLALLDDYTLRAFGMPASHCTMSELILASPNANLGREILSHIGLELESLGGVGVKVNGHRRNALNVPVQELMGGSAVVADADRPDAWSAYDTTLAAVATCGCGVAVDRDKAGRLLLETARPSHTCKEARA